MTLFQETIKPFHRSMINDGGLSPESIIHDSEAIAESSTGLGGSFRCTVVPKARTKKTDKRIPAAIRLGI